MRCPQVNRKGAQCVLPLGHHVPPLHIYQPLRTTGQRSRRHRKALDRCRQEVRERAEGLCEAAGYEIPGCAEFPHAGTDLHHLRKADRAENKHIPNRCVWLCRPAHQWVEEHPDIARAAGLWKNSWEA